MTLLRMYLDTSVPGGAFDGVLVNPTRIRGFNGVNLPRGNGTLEIRSPKEVTGNGDENETL